MTDDGGDESSITISMVGAHDAGDKSLLRNTAADLQPPRVAPAIHNLQLNIIINLDRQEEKLSSCCPLTLLLYK